MTEVSANRRPAGLLRSFGAVLAGLIAVVALSTAADAVMHGSGVFPPAGQPMAGALWALALAYRAVFQFAGGYLTARLAPRRPMQHVLVLAMIGLVLSIAGVVATWNRGPEFGPKWYPIALALLAVPTVWAGGLLHRLRALGSPA